MEDNLREFDIIEYYILPVHKKIRLSIIRTQTEFNNILTKYNGVKTKNIFWKLKNDPSFVRSFPMFGYHPDRVFYFLSNGLLAVNQYGLTKANPFYICESFEDFKLIAQYLFIFPIGEDGPMEIQCVIHEHFGIKDFLSREPLRLIEERSDERYKIFLAEDGKCIQVSYWGDLSAKKSDELFSIILNDPQSTISNELYKNENEYYWSLVIYDSIEKYKFHNVGT